MLGLIFLVFIILYLLLSYYVVMHASRFCQRQYGRRWLGGILAALVMYNLMFWDVIPARFIHYRLCSTEAGLKVYQTPEAWAKENPERYQEILAAAGRKTIRRSDDTPKESHSFVESTLGFEYEYYHQLEKNYAFYTGISKEQIRDKVTGKVLFENIDFYSAAGVNSLSTGADSFPDYKFWTVTGGCEQAYPGLKDKFVYQGLTFGGFHKIVTAWNKK